ncbi:heme biosynthesis protein HemY [Rhodobaculum claviforme]|uniref:Heme biosynthesis protein HemY n=1 Tax=Rhodobaculum claviforme TaxID=1549854 RepID=A0A934TIT5_9RHOB|nr:heme biosynthesis HemY N-terminal domain-containing protein [Rhodobaculum claviforme]MBK5926560.1 heme biosynthesis protein HemY [Rhodobaculum claviforme]
MLWTLLKIFLFVAAVAGLTMGAEQLMDTQEGILVAVAGMEFSLGPLQAVVAALLLLGALWLLLKAAGLVVATLKVLNGDDTALTRYFTRNREQRGLQALVEAMTALGAGEPRLAMSRAQRAEKLLAKPELTNLLSAQAAELQGDTARAAEYYKRMLGDRRTKFAGVRGLLRQRLAQGDRDTALKLAQKAFDLRPDHAETQTALLQLQAGTRDWSGARKTLLARQRAGGMPRDLYQRRSAVLALQQSADFAEKGEADRARDAALEANELSPTLVPAAAAAARAYAAQGKPKYAVKLLKKAWSANPSPELAAAFADIVPDESAQARLDRFQPLLALSPDHPETRMLKAELLISAEDFPAARRAIAPLLDDAPTARVLTIMAAVERGEGSDDAVVRGWLTKALSASRGPQWVCDSCQTVHPHWVAVCDGCGAFDSLSWRAPAGGAGPSPTQTEMLPLIVGRPSTSHADTHDPEEAAAAAAKPAN